MAALEDVQADTEVGIAVLYGGQVLAHLDLDAQLLSDFAPQAVGERFARRIWVWPLSS